MHKQNKYLVRTGVSGPDMPYDLHPYIWGLVYEFRTVLSIELGSVTLKINNQQSLMYAVRVGIRFLDSIFPRNFTSDVQHDPGAAGSE